MKKDCNYFNRLYYALLFCYFMYKKGLLFPENVYILIFTMKKPHAIFLGLQENVPGKKSIPLYNVIGGKFHKSTVTMSTLKKEGIKIKKSNHKEPL